MWSHGNFAKLADRLLIVVGTHFELDPGVFNGVTVRLPEGTFHRSRVRRAAVGRLSTTEHLEIFLRVNGIIIMIQFVSIFRLVQDHFFPSQMLKIV